jgi:hypothetical protein
MRLEAALATLTALFLAQLATRPTATPTPAGEGEHTVLVRLADGTAFPLRAWSLSYELGSWPRGSSPAFAAVRRVESTDVIVGGKRVPVTGSSLELKYQQVPQSREVDGEVRTVQVPIAREIAITGPDGRRQSLKVEPPRVDQLQPGLDKDQTVQLRSLDLMGETLTGTKRQLCLLSYTSLVECSETPAQQVLKLEFQN